ncbi:MULTISPECIES: exodeoxyribonuclease VII large subunit [unclassified Agarivorans]|uniref:exodeoxyribonuclease VII large subunit n=1 Tax=unclassified Agarivorans TaxID=2636026 RepID=UPI0026E296E4|nr:MULTISPECIES: exodeoxyribonuclease VII large subunit [unclassified Agarivorans]MDO6687340.1 exodeoxyribonuclease VII large subunit [Agarivorans sp. 3_MG-2023]MDO6716998.1 exodeoxyribonuclease VII large subunit [Agarivorans sp. 2_MG-2023]
MKSSQITNNVLSVSQLNQQVRRLLENSIGTIWLEGEISNFSTPFSGHWYFSLKDHSAQVRCAMFKGANRKVVFKPESGMKVLVKAKITMYEPRGDYQLIAEAIHPSGDGAMQQAYEQLKMKLAAEGLFADAEKQVLPEYPSCIGVVSSASGAALQDILTVLERRAPATKVIVYPASVQGELAAPQLIEMIELANQRDETDILIVGRGGGSKEDLWAFNDEQLARTIFDSNIPIISAVGHEVDDSISDLVADVRAATPSAAAEIVSQQASHIPQRMTHLKQQLAMHAMHSFRQQQICLAQLNHRIQALSPVHVLEQQQQRFDELAHRLSLSLNQQISNGELRHGQLKARLKHSLIERKVERQQQRVYEQRQRLLNASQQLIDQQQQQLAGICRQLDSLSPLKVLDRGFTLVTHQDKLVKHAAELKQGDVVKLKFSDDNLNATICS